MGVLSQSVRQVLKVDQRLAFNQFVKIEQAEWLEPEFEALASRLQEERTANGFLETQERSAGSRFRSNWKTREGYGSSDGIPRRDLTERHDGWLQNLSGTPQAEALIHNDLLAQLRDACLDDDELNYSFGEFVISHLDRFGRLAESLQTLLQSFHEVRGSCSEQQASRTLLHIQRFDPPGVAAQSDADRLGVMIERVADDAALAAGFCPPLRHIEILRELPRHFELLQTRQFNELARSLNADSKVMSQVLDELKRILRQLNFCDGFTKSSEPLVPDIVYSVDDRGQILHRVTMPRGSQIHVPDVYQSTAVSRSARADLNRAHQLVSAMSWRREMLDSIAHALVMLQGEFIRHGKDHLRPLLQKELAEELRKDDSTVSRVLHAKRIATPHGIYPIKVCFPKEVIAGSGVTEDRLKDLLVSVLMREPKDSPWADDRIASEMATAFRLPLARKTIQKYRMKFGIGTIRERRQLAMQPVARLIRHGAEVA